MSATVLPYRDPTRPVIERVADLLTRMTVDEKIGQLMMWDARGEDLSFVTKRHAGALLHILGDKANRAMDLAAATRLGIPLLIGEDAIHGHSFWKGATIFPTQLALACSWNPALLEQVARVTAREVVPTGIHWTFSPVLCLSRDLRWGRTGETFGEDPWLIGELGAAMIRGYQGAGLADPEGILATAKHYAGYSETQGGRDASEADLSRRKLRSYFLPPFRRAVQAGAMTFMTGYQSIDGVPSTANRWLLTEVLKDEWGFGGVLVTDWDNVGRLVHEQRVCADRAEAAAVALKAGNDLVMVTPDFFDGAREALERGLITEADLDAPCARLLALKFAMGLFEQPRRADLAEAARRTGCEAHRGVNLDAARQSLVLLHNDGLLPLDPKALRCIAVIGPNADDALQQLGDWSLGSCQHPPEAGQHPRETVTTVLDGIRRLAPPGLQVLHAAGCRITDEGTEGVREAMALAAQAEVVVAVVGDHLSLVGETLSTATLELQGAQVALLDALAASGRPFVLVLVNSKPLVLPRSALQARAIVQAFHPGMCGGQAVAEALFGRLNPSGRLPISMPVHVGQQPVFYSQVRGQHGTRYADLTQAPRWPFGHGLSYTRFAWQGARLDAREVPIGEPVTLRVTVQNVGDRHGVEVVQAYVSDVVTSVTWVQRALKGCARVELAPGESREVAITLPPEAFMLVDAQCREVIEPGDFEVQVGPSSRDEDLVRLPLTLLRR